LADKRYEDKNVEEISAMVGFANRQSFYAAFYKNMGETPNSFRKRNLEKSDKKEKDKDKKVKTKKTTGKVGRPRKNS
jgi:AraC-like DNA-binding protein